MDYRQLLWWIVGDNPAGHLRRLHDSGTLKVWLPEVDCLYGVPQRPEHHPEVDVGLHIELALNMAKELGLSTEACIAVLLHDLGKGVTPVDELPRHINHEATGLPLVMKVVKRLEMHGYVGRLAPLVCEQHLNVHRLFDMRATSVLALIDKIDLIKSDYYPLTQWVADLAGACEADARGRLGMENKIYHQAEYLKNVAQHLSEMPSNLFVPPQTAVWHQRHHARLSMIRAIRAQIKDKYQLA